MIEISRSRLLPLVVVLFGLIALTKMSAQTGTLYVATTGSNTSSCGTQTSPCATLTYAISSRAATGNTIIVNPGTYNDTSINVSKQVTITTTPAVISALTFNRGTVTGTDNRPYFPAAGVTISASGARVSYLRVRNKSAPYDGAYSGIIGVNATGVTIDHNELWNGNQGIQVNVKKQVTISQNHIHDLGSMSSSEDTHGVAICGTGTAAISWTEAISISDNTIERAGGDAVQEMTDAYCSGTFNFLVIANNVLRDNQEQAFDGKGTSDLRITGNDMSNNGEGAIVATNDPVVVSKMRWEISNNRIHDHKQYAINWAQTPNCGAWTIYNNLIYNNVTQPMYNEPAVTLCGDSASLFYNNVVYNNTDSGSTKSGGIKDNGSGAGIINNIFYNNGIGGDDHGSIWAISGEDAGNPSYNYIYPTTCGTACKTGTNVVTTCLTTGNCPGFVNIATRDFHLLASSPGINKGTTLGSLFTLDLDARVRGANGAWDLGAYEYGGTVTTAPAPPSNLRIIR